LSPFGGFIMLKVWLPFLFLIVSPLFGAPAYPFVDQNQIIGIHGDGTKVIFKTTHGEKFYDTAQKTWGYKVYTPSAASSEVFNPNTWNDQDFCSSQSDQGPVTAWSMKAVGEKAITNFELSNSISRKKYEIPFESFFHQFIIFQDNAWFWDRETAKIFRLNLISGKITTYLTQPGFPVQYAKVAGKLYFLNNRGLFFLDHNKIQGTAINTGSFIGKYGEMLAIGNKIYVLNGSMDDNPDPEKRAKSLLIVYDIEKGTISEVPLPIIYANHLVKKGETLIGYGRRIIDYSSESGPGPYGISGGVFSFSLNDGTMNKLTDLPVVMLDPLTMKAKAVSFDEGSALEKDLVFSPEKGRFIVSHTRTINFSEGNSYQYRWGMDGEKEAGQRKANEIAAEIAGTLVEYQTLSETVLIK